MSYPLGGYMGQILRVDLEREKTLAEPLPKELALNTWVVRALPREFFLTSSEQAWTR